MDILSNNSYLDYILNLVTPKAPVITIKAASNIRPLYNLILFPA